jgi:DNA repair exonuclease SbcCD nuclease subunit
MKFKIIATGDTHFGLTTDTNAEDPETGINLRSLDAFQAFDQLIDYAINNDVKLITHSGDVFNVKTVSQLIINEFYKRVKKISDNNIDFVILSGNHDKSKLPHMKCSLDLSNVLNIPHIYKSDGNDLFDLNYIQIATAGYYSKPEELENQLNDINNRIDWNRPSLLIGHLQVETPEFKYASFKEDLHFTPINLLTKYPYSYISLGHLHKYFKLNDNPPVYYNGSLVRCSFSEEKDDKGFNVIEFNGIEPVKIIRQNVECLKMLTLKGTMADIRAALKKATPENFVNVIVRVIVDTTDEDIDDKFFKTIFAQAFKARISKEAKNKELKKIDAQGLSSMTEYAEKFFEKEPRKTELMALLEEIKKVEESQAE